MPRGESPDAEIEAPDAGNQKKILEKPEKNERSVLETLEQGRSTVAENVDRIAGSKE